MKTMQLIAAGTLVGLFAAPALAENAGLKTGTYQIDPGHSYAYFSVDHMGLSTLQGRIDITDGTIKIADKRDRSTVNVKLDPSSVDTGNDKRDEHLRTMDGFFEVSKYPDMSFKSTDVNFNDGEATIKGRLTLHGQTHKVSLDADDMSCRVNPLDKSKYTCGFSATTTIQRSNYGMDAYSQLIGDEIDITLAVEANMPVDKTDQNSKSADQGTSQNADQSTSQNTDQNAS